MKRVLIIEDDLNIADLQKDYLEMNDYEVVIETDGVKGYETAIAGDFNLYIVDIMLPNMDGFQIIKQLRLKNDIPLIVVSARDDEVDKIRGLGLGANDYMTKPFSPSELLARVKTHMTYYDKLVGRETISNYIYKGIEINNDSRLVKVNSKEIKLTTKEYDLLWFLATHPNKVFTKEDLFDEIWSMELIGDTATVAVHIQRIRKKIEKDPGNPEYIETLWGTGYRFKG